MRSYGLGNKPGDDWDSGSKELQSQRFYRIMVSTQDSDSCNLSSILSRITCLFSSSVERLSCKEKVDSSTLSMGILTQSMLFGGVSG